MAIKPLDDETEILAKLAEGDERAFGKIYYHYSPRLFPFVDKMVRNRRLTEEIIQEVFIQLWAKKSLLADISHPSSYLFNIAANKTLDFQRKITRDKRLLETAMATAQGSHNETEERLIFNETAAIAREAIAALPAQRRLIYELSRNEGLSHKQIAIKLGISKSTVANQMVSALKQIRRFIESKSGIFSYAAFFFLTQK